MAVEALGAGAGALEVADDGDRHLIFPERTEALAMAVENTQIGSC